MLRQSRIRETLNLLVCANNNIAFFVSTLFFCAAVSIVFAIDVAVGTHRWALLVVDQIDPKADSVKILLTGDTDLLDQW